MNKFFLLVIICPLGFVACSDDGPQFSGPKADMTEKYPAGSLALGRSHHKKSADRVPFLSMPANLPPSEEGEVQSGDAGGGANRVDAAPHPVQTDTEVSYGPNK